MKTAIIDIGLFIELTFCFGVDVLVSSGIPKLGMPLKQDVSTIFISVREYVVLNSISRMSKK